MECKDWHTLLNTPEITETPISCPKTLNQYRILPARFAYMGKSCHEKFIEVNAGTPTVPETFDEDDFGAPSGDVAGSQFEVEADGIAGFGTAGFDLGPLGIYGKYGVISWDAAFSVDGFDAGSDDGTDPAYGVGVKFGLGSLEVRGEYEIYDIEDSEDVAMLSVGLVWLF